MKFTSKHTSTLTEKHQFQGYTNNCGPFCTAIAISYLTSNPVGGDQIAQEMNVIQWFKFPLSIKRIPNSATFPWGIVEMLKKHGVKSRWHIFSNLSRVAQDISDGNLIIVLTALYRPLSAHYRLLTGVDEKEISFIDPAYNQKSISCESKEAFLKKWRAAGNIFISIYPDASQ